MINNKYMDMPLEKINKEVDRLEAKCDKMFYDGMRDNLTWEEMEKKRAPWIKKLRQAAAAQTMKTPKESLQWEPYSDLDIECQVPLDVFIGWCKGGFVCSYDGHGVYADKDKVYHWFYARPGDIYNDYIRKDFEYVCWYNK